MPHMLEPELDTRWEWVNVQGLGDSGPVWIQGQCRHVDLVSVDSCVTGQQLARLCLTCDRQLPPRVMPAMWTQFPEPELWITMDRIR